MARVCKPCGSGRWHLGVCRACELVSKDVRKKLVRLCSVCKVDLCSSCYNNPLKRAIASVKQLFS